MMHGQKFCLCRQYPNKQSMQRTYYELRCMANKAVWVSCSLGFEGIGLKKCSVLDLVLHAQIFRSKHFDTYLNMLSTQTVYQVFRCMLKKLFRQSAQQVLRHMPTKCCLQYLCSILGRVVGCLLSFKAHAYQVLSCSALYWVQ